MGGRCECSHVCLYWLEWYWLSSGKSENARFPMGKVSIKEISTKSGGEKKQPKQTLKSLIKCKFTKEWSSIPPEKYHAQNILILHSAFYFESQCPARSLIAKC